MESYQILLSCLSFPNANSVSITKRSDLVKIVSWLEDRKIRELEISDRNSLRNDSDGWDSEFIKYLEKLGCPFSWTNETTSDCILWLVSYAVEVEYEYNADACRNIEGTISSVDSDKKLSATIDQIGDILGLKRLFNENDPDFLSRLNRILPTMLPNIQSTKEVIDTSTSSITLTLEDFPLGFDSGDEIVNKIATVLRMLHLVDLRDLQSDLNTLIVLGQQFTANPKTNAALGKVGR